MKKFLLITLGSLLFISIHSQESPKDSVLLFYLGGQSNMKGFGYTKDLPAELNKEIKNVYIFQGTPLFDGDTNQVQGKWQVLTPGHGFWHPGDKLGTSMRNRFGAELSFGAEMAKLYPNKKIAILKYSCGGTAISSKAIHAYSNWDPFYREKNGINQYTHFLSAVKLAYHKATETMLKKNEVLIPQGIVWLQGESDAAFTEEIALDYYTNLKTLMSLMRACFRDKNLPIVISKIADSGLTGWKHFDVVQAAQEKFVRNSTNCAIVRDAKHFNYSDAAHYDSKGYIQLGKRYAQELYKLNNK